MEVMSNSQKSVEELFESVLARSPHERSAYLNRLRRETPELYEMVEMLLHADEQAGSFLQAPLLTEVETTGHPARAGEFRSVFEPGLLAAGRFYVHRFLARGGMGEVYEAWDAELKERVAIKTIRPELALDPEVLERFRREVKQARAISHPHVCRVHELFCHELPSGAKVWFLSMEFLEGMTLRDHILHHGPLEPALALKLVEQIISGVSAAHRLGVIHRDLKTGNIMLVSSSPGHMRAVITDFGLAINVLHNDGSLPERGGQGTPDFMAPEQRRTGEVSAAADQYALGVIFCEMLTGSCRARDGSSAIPLPKTVNPRWKRVILRCLQEQPADRFSDVDGILTELRPSEKLWSWVRRGIAVSLVIVLAVVVWFPFGHGVEPTSLAVLPVQNRTGDPKLDYLTAGITEALTGDLARMPGLQVTAGSVARRLGKPDVDPRTAGKQLHAGSIVIASLENANGKLRIPIELIDVKTGRRVWGDTYEGSPSKLADLQDEISTDVAYELKVQLDANTAARLKRQYSTNPTAYDWYLKGRFHLAQRAPDAVREAINDFQRSLASDPHYAPAFAGMADCYTLLTFYGLERPKPLLMNALKTSQEALQLDSTLGEAYTSRALARTLLNFDWEGAEDDYKRAIELNPDYVQAHTWYALLLLTPQGRFSEARGQLAYSQAVEPDTDLTVAGVGTVELYAGRYEQAIQLLEPRIHRQVPFEPTVEMLATSYLAEQKNKTAVDMLQNTPEMPDTTYERGARLAAAYAKAGQRTKTNEILQRTLLRVNQGYPLAYETAVIYTCLGDHQKALDMLEIAFNGRESELVNLNVEPLLMPLHSEPRFKELLTRMTLGSDISLPRSTR